MNLRQAIKHCNKLANIAPNVGYGVIRFNKGYCIMKYSTITKNKIPHFHLVEPTVIESHKICECCGGLGFTI